MLNLSIELTDITLTLLKSSETVTSGEVIATSISIDLVFSLRDIYKNSNVNPLRKFTSSTRSTKFKDILLWNISQMITKTIPISTRIVIRYVMNGASC